MFNTSGIVLAEKPSIGIEPTRLYDMSRNKYHGIHSGIEMVQLPSGLWVRYSDAATDNVNFGDITQLNSTPAFSILGWFNQNVIDITDALFAKNRAVSTNRIFTFTSSDGSMYCDVAATVSSYGKFDYSANVTATKWFHFAEVFYGAGVDNDARLKVYIDVTPITLDFGGTTIPAITGTNQGVDFTIGYTSIAFRGFHGLFQIHNYALSAGQIKKIFEKQRHWFGR